MALVAAKCTQCGSNIQVDNTKEAGICLHCGTAFVTEKVITNYVTSYHTANYDNRTIIKNIHGKELSEAAEYIRNADAFMKMGDYKEAAVQLNLAIKADPSDWRVWFAMIRLSTKNFTDLSISAQENYKKHLSKAKAVATDSGLSELKSLCAGYEQQILTEEQKQRQAELDKIAAQKEWLKFRQERNNERKQHIKKIAKRAVIPCILLVVIVLAIVLPVTLIPRIKYSYAGNGYIVTGTVGIKKDEIVIPETHRGTPVIGIGDNAFKNFRSLSSITLPSSLRSIGGSAFSNCSGLTSITMPNGVTSIGMFAFTGCSGLTSITIPSGVTSIGKFTFAYCSGLTSITVSDSVKSIGDYVFYNCSGLTSITIPDSVTGIGNGAFSNCSGLTSVTIPSRVTSIGESAFYQCYKIKRVYYGGVDSTAWNTISIGSYNTLLTGATRYYYSKTYKAGDYWHWVDDVSTVWGA